jgi:hypothetical protein
MGSRLAAWLGLGICALALAAAPLLRHDPQCSLQSASHCDACMAQSVSLGADHSANRDAFHLQDAGGVEALQPLAIEPTFVVEGPSRSPPA